MGGHIWVISKDSGSEFHFALPLKTIESQQNSISYGNNLFA
jgi:signal transduction histidine kinase